MVPPLLELTAERIERIAVERPGYGCSAGPLLKLEKTREHGVFAIGTGRGSLVKRLTVGIV